MKYNKNVMDMTNVQEKRSGFCYDKKVFIIPTKKGTKL